MRENLKGHFVIHWSLKRDLKGKCVTLTIEVETHRTMIHIEHWGGISKDKYTLIIEWESQRMLLHVHTNIWWGISKNVVTHNNKRKSRMLIQILRGDLTHVFTHQHWGWVTTGKFVYSHSSSLFLSTHILASRSEGRALNLCILCWLAPNVPTQLIIPPKVSAQNVWRTVGSKSKL